MSTVDRETLRKAIISALPVDWGDYTTLVRVIPVPDESGIKTVWGRPEQVADAVIAALQQWLPSESDYPDEEAMAAIAAACTCAACMTGGKCIDDQDDDEDGACSVCLFEFCRCTDEENTNA